MQKTLKHETRDARELISALADGELESHELALVLRNLESSAEARAEWHAFHLVGDVLRAGSNAPIGATDEAFIERLSQRLHQQKVLPEMGADRKAMPAMVPGANDAVWRWKLVAGLSSLAMVTVLGWQLAAYHVDDGQGVGVAVQPAAQEQVPRDPQLAAANEAQIMIRDPLLDQLIAAHQQFGGTSALQMPAGFLRNATFERPAR